MSTGKPVKRSSESQQAVARPTTKKKTIPVPSGLPAAAFKQLGWTERLTDYFMSEQQLNRVINRDRDAWTPQPDPPVVCGQYELTLKGALLVNIGTEKNENFQSRRAVLVRKLSQAELDAIAAEEERQQFLAEEAAEAEAERMKEWRAKRYNPNTQGRRR